MKHPNYTQLHHKWRFKKLRAKADEKRRKELVAYHEAGHFIIDEKYGLNPKAKIYTNPLGTWIGHCSRDQFVSEEQLANIAIAGFMGEFCYILRCQGQLLKKLDLSVILSQREEMVNFFITTKDFNSVDGSGDADKIRLLHIDGKLNQTSDFTLRTLSDNLPRLYEIAECLFYENEYPF